MEFTGEPRNPGGMSTQFPSRCAGGECRDWRKVKTLAWRKANLER